MNQTTLGECLSARRKEKDMTQAELAKHMEVTDQTVSEWERDSSCPDITALSRLAELFGMTVDELLCGTRQENTEACATSPAPDKREWHGLLLLILRAMGLACGVAVSVLSWMGKIDTPSAIGILGIGLTALAASVFMHAKKE